MSTNTRENVNPESLFSVILVKVSISLESEFNPEGSKYTCLGDLELIRGLSGSAGSAGLSGSAGSGVSSRCSDPPQHAPEVRMT